MTTARPGRCWPIFSSPISLCAVPLCQDVDYYRSPALPLVKDIGNDTITRDVGVLAFNHPVPLNLTGDAQPLAVTSSRGWLDGNDNATLDDDETFGTYTLVARASYGRGELIVAGDADLLTNGLLKKGDNGVLLRNIMESGTVFVDTGHGQQVPPLASLFFALQKPGPGPGILCHRHTGLRQCGRHPRETPRP